MGVSQGGDEDEVMARWMDGEGNGPGLRLSLAKEMAEHRLY
jgi:hypothetical protein